VQRGQNLVLERDFDSSKLLFHTLFNSSVENFHAAFTFVAFSKPDAARKVAEKLLASFRRIAAWVPLSLTRFA
jgi:hypothetical protein